MKKRTLLSLLLTLAMALSLCSGALAAEDTGHEDPDPRQIRHGAL